MPAYRRGCATRADSLPCVPTGRLSSLAQADGSSVYVWRLSRGHPIDRHGPEPDEYDRDHWVLSPITGVPDITIPSTSSRCYSLKATVGQVPWYSPMSNKTEQLPVAMHLMSGATTDGMLLNRPSLFAAGLSDHCAVVETLGRAGVLKTVLTGMTAFPVDDTSPGPAFRVQSHV